MSLPSYERIKDSGTSWLGTVPLHWKVTSLKHIVSTPITDGPHETPIFTEEGVPFVSAEAVGSGQINFAKIRGYISEADHLRYSLKYHPKINDIYIIKSGATTGITAIVENDIHFNIWSPLAAIRCREEIEPRFVLNFLRSKNFQEGITLNWSFGTQQNIGMRVLGNLTISLPPYKEQLEIITFLDRETLKIEGLIAEQKLLIELLKEKRQAVISHAVTKGLNPNAQLRPSGIEWLGNMPQHWDLKPISRLIQNGTTITYGIVQAGPDVENGIPYIRTSDMYGYSLPEAGYMRTSQEIDQSYRRSKVKPNDLVVAIRASLGKGLLVPDFLDGANLTQGTARISPGDMLHPEFLFWSFNSIYCQTSIRYVAKGTTFLEITLDALRRVVLAVPPLSEQKQIVELIDAETAKTDKLTAEAERGIDLLQERRSALISAAVTGKIDVRNVIDAEAV